MRRSFRLVGQLWPEAAALAFGFLVLVFLRWRTPAWSEWELPLAGPPASGPRLTEDGKTFWFGQPQRPGGGLWDQDLSFRDLATGGLLYSRPTKDMVNPSNLRTTADGCVCFWRKQEAGDRESYSFIKLDPKAATETVLFGPHPGVAYPFFAPDGKSLLFLHGQYDERDWQGFGTLVDLASGQTRWVRPTDYFPRFSPDGQHVWLGHDERDWIHYTIHDRHTGSLLARVPPEGDLPVRGQQLMTTDFILLPDGTRFVLFSTYPRAAFEVWNVLTGKRERTLEDFGSGQAIDEHSLSVGGALLAVRQGGKVRVFDVATGELLHEQAGALATAQVRAQDGRATSFLRDDRWLALVGGADPQRPTLELVHARTGLSLLKLPLKGAGFEAEAIYALSATKIVVEVEMKKPAVSWLMGALADLKLIDRDFTEQLREYRVYDVETGRLVFSFPKATKWRDLSGQYLATGQLSPAGDYALMLEQREGGLKINQVELGAANKQALLASYGIARGRSLSGPWWFAACAALAAELALRGGLLWRRRRGPA